MNRPISILQKSAIAAALCSLILFSNTSIAAPENHADIIKIIVLFSSAFDQKSPKTFNSIVHDDFKYYQSPNWARDKAYWTSQLSVTNHNREDAYFLNTKIAVDSINLNETGDMAIVWATWSYMHSNHMDEENFYYKDKILFVLGKAKDREKKQSTWKILNVNTFNKTKRMEKS